MNHQSLSDLLSLAHLSPENLDKILEHDRWKTETILSHELKIEELRQRSFESVSRVDTSEEDKDFNKITSFSECNDSQVFKLSKTKVKVGITRFCSFNFPAFREVLSKDERSTKIPKDYPSTSIKALFTAIVYYVCCHERVKKWSLIKDKHSLLQVQSELEARCSTFDQLTLEVVYDSVTLFWPALFNNGLQLDDAEIRPIIESTYSNCQVITEPKDIKNSPLFRAVIQEYPNIDIDKFKHYYSMFPNNIVEACVRTLTLDFIQNRPSELDHTDAYAEWKDIYIDHLHSYKEKWKNKLKEIEISNWDAHVLWKKEE